MLLLLLASSLSSFNDSYERCICLCPISAYFSVKLFSPDIQVNWASLEKVLFMLLGSFAYSQRFEVFIPACPQPAAPTPRPALQPCVVWSILLHSCSSQFICTGMWDHPVRLTHPALQPLPGCAFSLPWLPLSAPSYQSG